MAQFKISKAEINELRQECRFTLIKDLDHYRKQPSKKEIDV
jgi:hypothetical protein